MRMIDADALLDAFAAENDAKECQWTLYGIKRKIEDAPRQEPCEDGPDTNVGAIISKQAVLDVIEREQFKGDAISEIEKLPPVNPQPKTGHWIMIDKELQRYKCSGCGEVIRLYKKSEIPKLEKDETLSNYPFSHCGCRMVESQESEG
jgi:hypothetical protein